VHGVEVLADIKSLISVRRCRRFLVESGLVVSPTDNQDEDVFTVRPRDAPWPPADVTDITPAAADAVLSRVVMASPHRNRVTFDKFATILLDLAKRRYGRVVNATRWKSQQPHVHATAPELHLAHLGHPWALVHYHLSPFIETCGYELDEVRHPVCCRD
jgi:hypothetical protein